MLSCRNYLYFSENKQNLEDEDHIIITMFISSEDEIKMHDIRAIEAEAKLLAVFSPFFVILKKLTIVRELMSDFNGLKDCDKATVDAVLDFSYNLSLGISVLVSYFVSFNFLFIRKHGCGFQSNKTRSKSWGVE